MLGAIMTDKNERAMEIVHSGDLYNSGDPDILQVQHSRLRYMEEYNQTRTSDADYAAREALLQKMFAAVGQGCYLEPPVHANWGGYNVSLGDHVYANFNLTLVDDGRIEIGSYVMIGPNVTITSGAHPISPALRDHDVQYNLPVIIEDHVWIGAGAIILPGVRIGKDSVIGAGSVVTKDIPAGSVAVGNPCRVIRQITEEDDRFFDHGRPIPQEIIDQYM